MTPKQLRDALDDIARKAPLPKSWRETVMAMGLDYLEGRKRINALTGFITRPADKGRK